MVGLGCGTWAVWTALGGRAEAWLCAQLSGGCILYPATLGDRAALLASVVAVQAVQALCGAALVAGLTEPVDFLAVPAAAPHDDALSAGPLLEALAAPDRALAGAGLFALAHAARDSTRRAALLARTGRTAWTRILDACQRPVAAFTAYLTQYQEFFRISIQQQPQFQPPQFLQQQQPQFPMQQQPQQQQFPMRQQQPQPQQQQFPLQQQPFAFQRGLGTPRWGAQPFWGYASRPMVRFSRESLRLVLRAGALWCVPALVLPSALFFDRHLHAVLRELQFLRAPPPHYTPAALQELLWALDAARALVPALVAQDTLPAVQQKARAAQLVAALTRLDAALRAVLDEEQRLAAFGALRPCAPMLPQERNALAALQHTLRATLEDVIGACNPTALSTTLDESVRNLLPSFYNI